MCPKESSSATDSSSICRAKAQQRKRACATPPKRKSDTCYLRSMRSCVIYSSIQPLAHLRVRALLMFQSYHYVLRTVNEAPAQRMRHAGPFIDSHMSCGGNSRAAHLSREALSLVHDPSISRSQVVKFWNVTYELDKNTTPRQQFGWLRLCARCGKLPVRSILTIQIVGQNSQLSAYAASPSHVLGFLLVRRCDFRPQGRFGNALVAVLCTSNTTFAPETKFNFHWTRKPTTARPLRKAQLDDIFVLAPSFLLPPRLVVLLERRQRLMDDFCQPLLLRTSQRP